MAWIWWWHALHPNFMCTLCGKSTFPTDDSIVISSGMSGTAAGESDGTSTGTVPACFSSCASTNSEIVNKNSTPVETQNFQHKCLAKFSLRIEPEVNQDSPIAEMALKTQPEVLDILHFCFARILLFHSIHTEKYLLKICLKARYICLFPFDTNRLNQAQFSNSGNSLASIDGSIPHIQLNSNGLIANHSGCSACSVLTEVIFPLSGEGIFKL